MSGPIGTSAKPAPPSSKLLIVEDEDRIAAFVIKGFRALGYRVDHVRTGTDALAAAADPEVDLIILDLGLPDVDGLEVLRRLRRTGLEVPVVILSARAEPADRIEALGLSLDDYVTKPFAFGELSSRVRARIR